MGLVVEDGTSPAGANGYVSATEYRAYCADRGIAIAGSVDDAAIGTFIVRATDYIERTCAGAFLGEITASTQPLSWPRTGAILDGAEIGSTTIPSILKHACIEVARRAALYQELIPDAPAGFARADASGAVIPAGGPVKVSETEVGPVRKLTEFFGPSDGGSPAWPGYEAVNRLLRRLCRPAGVIRA